MLLGTRNTLYAVRLASLVPVRGPRRLVAAQLTIDERNLLSIAYKNLTANLRASWRTIDALQKKEALSSTRQQVKLMRVQKDRIEKDLDKVCRDVVDLLERYLIPAASDGEEKVFYSKMCVVLSW